MPTSNTPKFVFPTEFTWSAVGGLDGKKPIIIRRNDAAICLKASPEYPYLVCVTMKFTKADQRLMARDEDCDVVGPIETALVTAFERDRLALLVATVAYADSFIWHFYTRDLREIENRLNAVVPSLPGRKVNVEAERDPTWQA